MSLSNPELKSLEECPIAPTVPLREVRLAISMVGGTSLAIYENGVTQELLRLVQGRGAYGLLKRLTRSHAYIDILSGTSAGGINSIFLSTALANGHDTWATRDVWVDEAGIDVLLPDPGDGSVRSILKGDTHYWNALLKAFRGILQGTSCSPTETGPRPARLFPLRSGYDGDNYSRIDLFVTGTYIEGMPSVFFDTRNQPIFNENHNGVFHLKHRPDRRESHFCPALDYPADLLAPGLERRPDVPSRQDPEAVSSRLARVARTTSSLPAIFEPSAVHHEEMVGIIPLPKTREKDPKTQRTTTYFGDGGYLNNRPLNLVLGKIRSRASGPEVMRKLVFVEPVAERLRRQVQVQKEPTALEHLAFYASVQGKQSLRDQLQSILDHNHRVRRVRTGLQCARVEAEAHAARGLSSCGEHGNHEEHRETASTSAPGPAQALWIELRLQEIRDTIIGRWEEFIHWHRDPGPALSTEEILAIEQGRAERLRKLRTYLLEYLETHCHELDTEEASFSLNAIDADYVGRRLMRLKDDIRDTLYPRFDDSGLRYEQRLRQEIYARVSKAGGAPADDLKTLSRLIGLIDLIRVLTLGIVDAMADSTLFRQAILSQELEQAKRSTADVADAEKHLRTVAGALWTRFHQATSALLAPLGPLQQLELPQFADALRTRSAAICKAIRNEGPIEVKTADSPPVLNAIVLEAREVVDRLADSLAGVMPPNYERPYPLPFDWAYENGQPKSWEEIDHFQEHLDRHLYPVERAADLPNLSPIELVHISARDVQVGLSRESAENKLAGDVLMNLGGFFKRAWRANDVLWGRLDASGALVEMLVDPARLERVVHEARKIDGGKELMTAIRGYLETGSPQYTREIEQSRPPTRDSIGRYLHAYPEAKAPLKDVLKEAERWFSSPDEALNPAWVAEHLSTWLLRRHQLEILLEELPAVVADDLSEHAEWQGAGLTLSYDPTVSGTDRAALKETERAAKKTRKMVDHLAALVGGDPGRSTHRSLRTLARDWVEKQFGLPESDPVRQAAATAHDEGGATHRLARRLDAARVHQHFRTQYQTGTEAITVDIPGLVTARRVSASMLIIANVLRSSLRESQSAQRLSKTLAPLVTPVMLVLRVLHGMINLVSQGKGVPVAVHTALVTLAVVGCLWGIGMFPVSEEPPAWVVAGAAAVAVLEMLFWSWKGGARRSVGVVLALAGALLGIRASLYWLKEQHGSAGSGIDMLARTIPAAVRDWSWAIPPVLGGLLVLLGAVLYWSGTQNVRKVLARAVHPETSASTVSNAATGEVPPKKA